MSDDTRSDMLEQFQDVKYVGPSYAQTFYDDLEMRSYEDIVEAADDDRLTEVSGIGASKQASIRESAAALLETQREQRKLDETEEADEAGAADETTEVEDDDESDVSGDETDTSADSEDAAGVRTVSDAPRTVAEADDLETDEATEEASEAIAEAYDAAEAAVEEASDSEEDDEPSDDQEETTSRSPRPRIERFIERLRCPACGHDAFERTQSTLTCHACRRDYDMDEGVVDVAPPQTHTGGLAQRVMESNLYARFYENVMRPNLTKLVSSRTMEEERELAADYLELDADSTLLDVATGTGNFIRHFAKRIASESSGYDDQSLAVGMDISWPMLEQARTFIRREGLTDRVFLLRGDATRIPLGRETFSHVHCAGGLHLMDGAVDEVLRNFSRVLEPGGLLVVSTFLVDGSMLKQLAKRIAGMASHFHWFGREELHDRLERAGLEVEEESIAQEAITIKARRG